MLNTDKVIIVEGRYDKSRLAGVTDALIVTTEGFGIFSDREKKEFIKKLAAERGIVIFIDSDAAGFKIRNYIKNIPPAGSVIHAYIPDVAGKERRKASPSKEGKLGVEGIDNDILKNALLATGCFSDEQKSQPGTPITTAELYELGLTGGTDSAELRRRVLTALGLPVRLKGGELLSVLNGIVGRERLVCAVKKAKER